VKSGVRALGVAESSRGSESSIAGVVVRASRVVDGVAFATCTVGGTDATKAVTTIWDRLDRADIQYVFLAGIAPAWFNVLDLPRIHEHVERPVLSVTFEASPGLDGALREAFDGDALADRLDRYRAQPPREEIAVNDETVFVRTVGLDDDPADIVRTFTPEGGRPEPLRVARLAARGADEAFVAGDDTGV